MGIEDTGNAGAYHGLLTSEEIWILTSQIKYILALTYLNATYVDEIQIAKKQKKGSGQHSSERIQDSWYLEWQST